MGPQKGEGNFPKKERRKLPSNKLVEGIPGQPERRPPPILARKKKGPERGKNQSHHGRGDGNFRASPQILHNMEGVKYPIL